MKILVWLDKKLRAYAFPILEIIGTAILLTTPGAVSGLTFTVLGVLFSQYSGRSVRYAGFALSIFNFVFSVYKLVTA